METCPSLKRSPGARHTGSHRALRLTCLNGLLDELGPMLCIADMTNHTLDLEPLGLQGLHCLVNILLTPADAWQSSNR
jgi:hypothetical protein